MAFRSRSVEAARFSMVPRVDVPRSAFDVSHTHKTTFHSGYLIPVLVLEVLPADSIRCSMTAFCRLATPIVPVLDNLHLESFFFFVPNRLLWENWERFMGQQLNPSDTTEFLVPYINQAAADWSPGTLQDYFGIPGQMAAGTTIQINSLPFRAYNLIWNDWFRDEDLQTPVTVPLTDGPDGDTWPVLRRGKRHDYFTSCRPWPQKPGAVGDTGSMGGSVAQFLPGGVYSFPGAGAPVSGIGIAAGLAPTAGALAVSETGNRNESWSQKYYASNAAQVFIKAQPVGNFPDVRVLINDIRTAEQIQMLMERNARGGTRYTELIRSHFGVISPDARLQRPEFLGGGRTMVTVNPVAQTSATGVAGTTTVLGELAGVGSAVAQNHGFSQSFTEHGYIIGMVAVRADLSYQQGLHRMWSRRGRYDFYWPSLAHLGEQAVLSREIYCTGQGSVGAGDLDYSVFGYQERWAEYRSLPSRVSGYFRSTSATPLDMWHFSQKFTARPTLNSSFVEDNPPVDRVLTVTGHYAQEFLMDALFDLRMVRAMPMFSVPGMGHRL